MADFDYRAMKVDLGTPNQGDGTTLRKFGEKYNSMVDHYELESLAFAILNEKVVKAMLEFGGQKSQVKQLNEALQAMVLEVSKLHEKISALEKSNA